MPYIGNDIQFGELTSQTFTGDGSTVAFTMGYSVANTTSILVTSGNVVQEPTVAYTVSGTTLTFTSAPEDDDTIHVRFLGRVVDVANAAILQDSDQDTKVQVEESADEDTIRFDVAGTEVATLTNSTLILKGTTPTLFINDTANAKTTVGLTINQGAADDEILAFKSSDIAHGVTDTTETDTWGVFRKVDGAAGGMEILGLSDTAQSGLRFFSINHDGRTDKDTAAGGHITFVSGFHSGTEPSDVAADTNIFHIAARVGGTERTLFILDEDGDIHNDGADSAAFDAWDDAALLRALELWRGLENPETVQPHLLASRYDGNKYTKEQIETAKVIQVLSDDDWKAGKRALVNSSAQSRITTGAIWQNHEMLDAIIETMEERDSGFTAALKKKFVARGLPTQILDWTGDIPDDLKKPDTAPKAFNAD